MKVILRDKVKTLGNVGEVVNVSEGYARNFLIPNELAILADASNKKQIADYEKMLAKKVEEQKSEAKKLAASLKGYTLTLEKKVGGNGRIFGTVTSSEISKALEANDLAVEKRLLAIDTPIKTLGEYQIVAKLFKDVEQEFTVNVIMDAKQKEEMAKAAAKKKAEPKKEKKEEASAETTEEAEAEA